MSLAREVLQLAEQHRDLTARNLSRLVQIPSLSGQEREVNAELAAQLEAAGFDEVTIDPLGNCIGRIGRGPRLLAIDAHMDTVDVGEPANWSFDPFGGEVRDGFVHGRGSVDQEGGAAAFVTAGRIVKELGLRDELTLVVTGTVMEEDCDGLCWKYLIEEGGLRPDLVISTEPTNLGVYRGQRGRMEMGVSFRGISCHGSAPERGDNAVYKAARACLAIEDLHPRLKPNDFPGQRQHHRHRDDQQRTQPVRGARPGPPAPGPPPHRGRDAGERRGRGRGRRGGPRRHRRGAALRRPGLHRPAVRHAEVLPDLGHARRPSRRARGRRRGRGPVRRAARGRPLDLLHQRHRHQRPARHPLHRLRPRRRGPGPRSQREGAHGPPGQRQRLLRPVRPAHGAGA